MLISGRHFPIGNSCNITILNYGAINTITEDQIKAMSGHRSHDILVLTTAVPSSLSAKWTHVKKKQKTATMANGYRMLERIKNFLKSLNQQMPIRISYNVRLFVFNDYHRIWRHVLSVGLKHWDSKSKSGENGTQQCNNLISCISMFLSQKVIVILSATSNFIIQAMKQRKLANILPCFFQMIL